MFFLYNILYWLPNQQNFKEEAKKQRNLLFQLERERDRYGKDATDATHKCLSQVRTCYKFESCKILKLRL